jgi:hypothetical protein
VEITLTALIGIPSGVLALVTLIVVAPIAGRRRHMQQAESLAKLVDAAADQCPRALKVELHQQINWVAAYHSVRLSDSDKTKMENRVLTSLGLLIPYVGGMVRGGLLGIIVAAAAVLPLSILLTYVLASARRLAAQRRLFAKLGGRSDVPELLGPMWWPIFNGVPTAYVIDRWIRNQFNGVEPLPSAIHVDDIKAIRRRLRAYYLYDLNRHPAHRFFRWRRRWGSRCVRGWIRLCRRFNKVRSAVGRWRTGRSMGTRRATAVGDPASPRTARLSVRQPPD